MDGSGDAVWRDHHDQNVSRTYAGMQAMKMGR
jgi:hypothetical protein